MFDEYFEPTNVVTTAEAPPLPPAADAPASLNSEEQTESVSITQDAPSENNSQTLLNSQPSSLQQGSAVDNSFEVNSFAPPDEAPFENIFAPESS